MHALLSVYLAASIVGFAPQQGHDLKPAEAIKNMSFLLGNWKGKQNFNNPQGPMVATVEARIKMSIGDRFVEEAISGVVEGGRKFETRHFMSYDANTKKYKAWWFNDTSYGPQEYEGDMVGNKLVMSSKGGRAELRVTYEKISDKELGYWLEMKQGEDWVQLFKTVYSK